MIRITSRFAGGALAVLLVCGAAVAQQTGSVSSAELDKYAAAYVEVQKVVAEFQGKTEQAESDSEAKQIRETYRRRLAEAVKAEGLSVTQYNSIYKQVQENPALRDRAIAKITEERASGE